MRSSWRQVEARLDQIHKLQAKYGAGVGRSRRLTGRRGRPA